MSLRSASASTGHRRNRLRARLAAGAAVAMVAGTAAALGAPGGVALASCGTYGSGEAGTIANGGHIFFGTIWHKKPPGCYDFNVVYVHNPNMSYDYYTGWYESGSNWIVGASGPHKLYNGSYNDFALVTNVVTGTPLTIIDEFGVADTVHVNY